MQEIIRFMKFYMNVSAKNKADAQTDRAPCNKINISHILLQNIANTNESSLLRSLQYSIRIRAYSFVLWWLCLSHIYPSTVKWSLSSSFRNLFFQDRLDTDSNGDGVVDCKPRDTDGDGIPDHLDPDDDNDGIPDYLDPDSMAFLLYKNTKAMDAVPGILESVFP